MGGLSQGCGEKATFGMKKWSSRMSFICSGVSASGSEGKRVGVRPKANDLAVHRFLTVALSKKEDQCVFLPVLIALKYPDFVVLATSRLLGVSCFLAALAAMLNSRWWVVRWGVHQGLE